MKPGEGAARFRAAGGVGGDGVVVLDALSRRHVSLEMDRSRETERIAVPQSVEIGRERG